MSTYSSLSSWQDKLRFEYPEVHFENTEHPEGVNAVCEGVLVGRFFRQKDPSYGVVYEQTRSCGGRTW
ncbi:MAG: hypothetical protein GC151_00610 [Betaproteobacteria bacterium]|nr:hypothetical protein [Betaproteobacteria bacterium]